MNLEIAKSITRNTTVMMGSQVVTWISSFLLMLFLPRYLGSEEYGRLFLAISVAMIFQVLIEFGGTYHITKMVARDKSATPTIFVNSVALRIILWLASVILLVGFAFIAGYSREVKLLLLIFGISKLWEGALGVMQRCFQGHELMKHMSVGNISEKVFLAVTGVTALLIGAKSLTIALLMGASTLLNFFVCTRFLPKILTSFPKVSAGAIKTMAKESVPYFLWTLFGVIYYRVDAVMLSLMAPSIVVGWYGAAYRFFDILMFFPSILTTAIFPIFSKLWTGEKNALSLTTQKSLDFMLLAAIPISVVSFMCSGQIISLFFGLKEFGPTVQLMQIFSIGLLIVYSNFIMISLVVASDHQRHWLKIAFLAMLLNPVLNYLLIPYFQAHTGNGGLGSAIATLITEFFLMIMAISITPRMIFSSSKIRVLSKGLAAGLVMAGILKAAENLKFNWIAAGAAAVLLYVSMLFLIKTFNESELKFIRSYLYFWKQKQPAGASAES